VSLCRIYVFRKRTRYCEIRRSRSGAADGSLLMVYYSMYVDSSRCVKAPLSFRTSGATVLQNFQSYRIHFAVGEQFVLAHDWVALSASGRIVV